MMFTESELDALDREGEHEEIVPSHHVHEHLHGDGDGHGDVDHAGTPLI